MRRALHPLQQRHALDVRRLREHVDRYDAPQRVAGLDELRSVWCERRRVAGDVHNTAWRGLDHAADDLLGQTGPRRVQQTEVRAARLLAQRAEREAHVAGEELRVADAVAAGV